MKEIYLKKTLRDNFDDFEGFPKKGIIISLNEESGEQNQDYIDIKDIKPKKKTKKTKGKKQFI